MKKFYLTVMLLSSVLFLWCSLSLNNTKNTEDWKLNNQIEEAKDNDTLFYENKTENFSFNFLKDRTFQENRFWFNTIVFTPEDDWINENVWIKIQKLQKFLSVQEYYEETINEIKDTVIWFKEIKTENISIEKLNGKKIVYEHQTENENLKSQYTFLMSKDNTVYSIVYTATKKSFDKFIKWANIILNTFKVNE